MQLYTVGKNKLKIKNINGIHTNVCVSNIGRYLYAGNILGGDEETVDVWKFQGQ